MQVFLLPMWGVEWDDTLKRRLRTYTWLGKEVPSERIRHLRFHPRAGELRGLSPIEAARVTWEGAAASERWGSNLFADGVPSGVLTAPTLLTGPESNELKKQWDEARRGKRDTAVLSGGMKYEPVELTPSEIQWLEGRAIDCPRDRSHLPHSLRHAGSGDPRRSLFDHLSEPCRDWR